MKHYKLATSDCIEPSLDPMDIERIDVEDLDDGGAVVLLWGRGSREPLQTMFEVRAAAIAYVREIWESLQSRRRMDEDAD